MDFHCRVCLLEGRNPGRAEETIKHADKLIMILFTSQILGLIDGIDDMSLYIYI